MMNTPIIKTVKKFVTVMWSRAATQLSILMDSSELSLIPVCILSLFSYPLSHRFPCPMSNIPINQILSSSFSFFPFCFWIKLQPIQKKDSKLMLFVNQPILLSEFQHQPQKIHWVNYHDRNHISCHNNNNIVNNQLDNNNNNNNNYVNQSKLNHHNNNTNTNKNKFKSIASNNDSQWSQTQAISFRDGKDPNIPRNEKKKNKSITNELFEFM